MCPLGLSEGNDTNEFIYQRIMNGANYKVHAYYDGVSKSFWIESITK